MKLTLRLITNKPVNIDLDFRYLKNQTVSLMMAKEHSEKIIEFELPNFKQNPDKVYIQQLQYAIKQVIKNQYYNITSIEGLQELDNLIEK